MKASLIEIFINRFRLPAEESPNPTFTDAEWKLVAGKETKNEAVPRNAAEKRYARKCLDILQKEPAPIFNAIPYKTARERMLATSVSNAYMKEKKCLSGFPAVGTDLLKQVSALRKLAEEKIKKEPLKEKDKPMSDLHEMYENYFEPTSTKSSVKETMRQMIDARQLPDELPKEDRFIIYREKSTGTLYALTKAQFEGTVWMQGRFEELKL